MTKAGEVEGKWRRGFRIRRTKLKQTEKVQWNGEEREGALIGSQGASR